MEIRKHFYSFSGTQSYDFFYSKRIIYLPYFDRTAIFTLNSRFFCFVGRKSRRVTLRRRQIRSAEINRKIELKIRRSNISQRNVSPWQPFAKIGSPKRGSYSFSGWLSSTSQFPKFCLTYSALAKSVRVTRTGILWRVKINAVDTCN